MISNHVIKIDSGRRTSSGKKILLPMKTKMLVENGRIYVHFPYNKTLVSEIKSFEGHHWHGQTPNRDYKPKPIPKEFLRAAGTDKCWSISDSHRNRFQLSFLLGGNPYQEYDAEIKKQDYIRSLYEHQKEMTDFLCARHYAIIAGEMGTGKTLCAIEMMERSGYTDWWYVAPKSVLRTITRELKIWGCTVRPELMTYNRLVTLMKEWPEGNKAPHGVIYDESARIKTPTSQRAQAAKQLADGIRSDWGNDGYVVEMSGAPAPLAPTDWWHQCEVACPGFLKEGTIGKFKVRLGLFKEKESFAGGVYLEQVTWLDDENKCSKCGQYDSDRCAKCGQLAHAEEPKDKHEWKPAPDHIPGASEDWHPHMKSVNEVSQLYKRMNGLVIVKFKKDCLDLPEKIYREVDLKPTPAILRAASMIARTSKTTIQALTLLRELSDGFQYQDVESGDFVVCPLCHGEKTIIDKVATDVENQYEDVTIECPYCEGTGDAAKIVRTVQQVECPKEDFLRELLDEHYDIGRLVTYAAFTGSVDRCVNTSLSEGWDVIRVDGRGWKFFSPDKPPIAKPDFLAMFQDQLDDFARINFVGQAGAAGSGHTLTRSPSIYYYSNDFNADSRIQSEDRIHRIGMDKNRGATIIDGFHLPSDRLVYGNLKIKRKLQSLSLGEVQAALAEAVADERLF